MSLVPQPVNHSSSNRDQAKSSLPDVPTSLAEVSFAVSSHQVGHPRAKHDAAGSTKDQFMGQWPRVIWSGSEGNLLALPDVAHRLISGVALVTNAPSKREGERECLNNFVVVRQRSVNVCEIHPTSGCNSQPSPEAGLLWREFPPSEPAFSPW